jgi:hypothetical protein
MEILLCVVNCPGAKDKIQTTVAGRNISSHRDHLPDYRILYSPSIDNLQ